VRRRKRASRLPMNISPTLTDRPLGDRWAQEQPAAIGAAASGACDDLALIHGIGRERETRLNELGIHSYQKVAALSDGEAIDLETRFRSFTRNDRPRAMA